MTTLTPTLPQAPTTSVLGQMSRPLQIDSISVSADVIDATRRNIAVAEQRFLLDAARAPAAQAHRGPEWR